MWGRARVAGGAALLCVAGVLAANAAGATGPEDVIAAGGGHVVVKLDRLPRGVKATKYDTEQVGPNRFELDVLAGTFDPSTASGLIGTRGGFKLRFRGGHARVNYLDFAFGARGTAVDAEIATKLRRSVGKLRRPTFERVGFGGAVTAGRLVLTARGARLLNDALGAQERKPFRPGRLGRVTASYQPQVVVAAGGELALRLDEALLAKLASKGVGAASITGSPPATFASGTARFPFERATLPLDERFGTAQIHVGGGLSLTKNTAVGGGCEASRPLGSSLSLADLRVWLGLLPELVASVHPSGAPPSTEVSIAALGPRTIQADATARRVTVTQQAVLTSDGAAALNSAFGSAGAGCGAADFAAGEALGVLIASGTAR